MFTQQKFQANLLEGQQSEKAIVELLKLRGNDAWPNTLNVKDCDLWVRTAHGVIPVEVKTDFASLYTGNVAIEHATLAHTKAQYFVYVIPSAYLIDTPHLRLLAKDPQYHKSGGDQNHALSIIPLHAFLPQTQILQKEK